MPADDPLRAIRTLTDEALRSLSAQFERLYSTMGRPSIPPEQLLRALLLQVLYTVRSETAADGGARLQPAVPMVRRVAGLPSLSSIPSGAGGRAIRLKRPRHSVQPAPALLAVPPSSCASAAHGFALFGGHDPLPLRAEGVPDLVEGRWRLLPDCDIGRVFMRKGAATDEETLQDRARHIHGQQPGAGGLAGEGRATAGSAGRVAGEGGTGHRRSDRRHGPGDGRSGPADERRTGGGAEGAGAPRSRPGGVLAWRAGRPGSAEGTAVAGRQAAAAQETAACRRVGRGRGSGLHGASGRPAAG